MKADDTYWAIIISIALVALLLVADILTEWR